MIPDSFTTQKNMFTAMRTSILKQRIHSFAYEMTYSLMLTATLLAHTYIIKSSMSIDLARFPSELLFCKMLSTFCFMSKLSGMFYSTK